MRKIGERVAIVMALIVCATAPATARNYKQIGLAVFTYHDNSVEGERTHELLAASNAEATGLLMLEDDEILVATASSTSDRNLFSIRLEGGRIVTALVIVGDENEMLLMDEFGGIAWFVAI